MSASAEKNRDPVPPPTGLAYTARPYVRTFMIFVTPLFALGYLQVWSQGTSGDLTGLRWFITVWTAAYLAYEAFLLMARAIARAEYRQARIVAGAVDIPRARDALLGDDPRGEIPASVPEDGRA